MEFLLRDDAPFDPSIWNKIDELVVSIARKQLVGRRFLNIYGPLGAGVQSIHMDQMHYDEDVELDLFGDNETTEIRPTNRKYVSIPMLYKDFMIPWRDIETHKLMNTPLDLGPVSASAAVCIKKEDTFIFHGSKEADYPGIMNAEGRQVVKKGDWATGEEAFQNVAQGIEKLLSKGCYEPFTLVMSPVLYAQLQRIQPGTGTVELERIKGLVDGRVYQSPVLTENQAVLVANARQNMDLVVGQDMITAYIGPDQLNHHFRILETLVPRIKRSEAIVTFE